MSEVEVEAENQGNGEQEVLVQVVGDEDDESADVQALARALRIELLRLDVEQVDLVTEESLPEGAKGLSLITGLLNVRAVAKDLRAIVDGLRNWIARNNRSITITLDGDTLTLSAANNAERETLIELFVKKHSPS
jgi:hypothetical protein